MNPESALALLAALAGYAGAFGAALLPPRPHRILAARALLAAALIAHTAALALEAVESGMLPLPGRLGTALAAVSWLAVIFCLLLDRPAGAHPLPVFLAPPIILLGGGALLLSACAVPMAAPPHTALETLHGLVACAGLSAFAAAFLNAMMYLLQERYLRGKRPGRLAGRLPPLETLERAGRRAALGGFLLFSAAILTGFASLAGGAGPPPAAGGRLAPVALWSLAAWGVYALILLLGRLPAGRGRRAAWLRVLGFLLVLGAFVGGTLLAPRGQAHERLRGATPPAAAPAPPGP